MKIIDFDVKRTSQRQINIGRDLYPNLMSLPLRCFWSIVCSSTNEIFARFTRMTKSSGSHVGSSAAVTNDKFFKNMFLTTSSLRKGKCKYFVLWRRFQFLHPCKPFCVTMWARNTNLCLLFVIPRTVGGLLGRAQLVLVGRTSKLIYRVYVFICVLSETEMEHLQQHTTYGFVIK